MSLRFGSKHRRDLDQLVVLRSLQIEEHEIVKCRAKSSIIMPARGTGSSEHGDSDKGR